MSELKNNKWSLNRETVNPEILQLADEASMYIECSKKMHDSLVKLIKEYGVDERKNYYNKASKNLSIYKIGIKYDTKPTVEKINASFDTLANVGRDFSSSMNTTVICKLYTHKEVESKEIENKMKLLKKTQNDYDSKKKKSETDEKAKAMLPPLEEALQKAIEESRALLTVFNDNSLNMFNQAADNILKIMKKHLEDSIDSLE